MCGLDLQVSASCALVHWLCEGVSGRLCVCVCARVRVCACAGLSDGVLVLSGQICCHTQGDFSLFSSLKLSNV